MLATLGLFAVIYLFLSALMVGLIYLIQSVSGVAMDGTSIGWIPTIVAAMMTGQNYAKKAMILPPKGFAWMAGLGFAVINVALFIGMVFLVMSLSGPHKATVLDELVDITSDGDLPIMLAVLAGLILLLWVLLRFGFTFGAKQGIAQANKGKAV
jgi:hypothetical protein